MRGKPCAAFRLDEEIHDSNEAWEARLHPDDLLSVREHVRQQNSGEIPHFNFEYRERRLDGRWIWILARGRTVAWDEKRQADPHDRHRHRHHQDQG